MDENDIIVRFIFSVFDQCDVNALIYCFETIFAATLIKTEQLFSQFVILWATTIHPLPGWKNTAKISWKIMTLGY